MVSALMVLVLFVTACTSSVTSAALEGDADQRSSEVQTAPVIVAATPDATPAATEVPVSVSDTSAIRALAGCTLGAATSTNMMITQGECGALVALFTNTGGERWSTNDGWTAIIDGGETDPCGWFGVSCSSELRLIGLDLFSNGLSGGIPPQLGDLSSLELLDLSVNGLSGRVPPELGDLSNLQVLVLSSNELSGLVPSELGGLSNLQLLNLTGNDLAGLIPSGLGGLSNLQELWLGFNAFGGPIPSELSDLARLDTLSLNSNELSGEIPPELGGLSNLEVLVLSANELSGEIPSELGDLLSLRFLNLMGNDLEGPIPPEFGRLSNLEGLNLTDNRLSGEVPSSLMDLPFGDQFSLQVQGNGCLTADSATETWMAANFSTESTTEALNQGCSS